MILILTDEFDTHADAVIAKMTKCDVSLFRLDLNVEALKRTHISSSDGWAVAAGDNRCELSDVRAVWARRLTVSQTLEQQHEPDDPGSRLWRSERNRSLYGMYVALREKPWLNPIQAAGLADNKLYQAAVAERVGLRIPPFLISNDKAELVSFASSHEDVALKFMSQDMFRAPNGEFQGIYVNKIGVEDLARFGESDENPVTLQKYIKKSFEVRYTVVGDKHYVCAIHSQKSETSSTDWRRYDLPNTPHHAMDPPAQVRKHVVQLMTELGLMYGAIDFIVDEAGDWWFLEVNTAGQWLWIEDLTGLPISEGISNLLVSWNGEMAV